MTIKIAAPWVVPSVTIPPWQASLGGPLWMLNSPGDGTDGTQGGQGAATGGTTGQGAGTTDSTTGTTDTTTTGAGQSADQSSSDQGVSRAEFEQVRNQLSAADKARQAAEDKIKVIEDAKKDDATKATERAEAAEAKVSALEQEIQQMRLERAVLTDPEWGADKWHDPDDVLVRVSRAVKDQQISLKDGEPDGAQIKTFLKDLSTKKAYLLKTTAGAGEQPKGKSGTTLGAGDRRTAGDKDSDDELRRRYRIR